MRGRRRWTFSNPIAEMTVRTASAGRRNRSSVPGVRGVTAPAPRAGSRPPARRAASAGTPPMSRSRSCRYAPLRCAPDRRRCDARPADARSPAPRRRPERLFRAAHRRPHACVHAWSSPLCFGNYRRNRRHVAFGTKDESGTKLPARQSRRNLASAASRRPGGCRTRSRSRGRIHPSGTPAGLRSGRGRGGRARRFSRRIRGHRPRWRPVASVAPRPVPAHRPRAVFPSSLGPRGRPSRPGPLRGCRRVRGGALRERSIRGRQP